MVRKLVAAAVLGLCCFATSYAADDARPGAGGKGKFAGKMDKGALFARADADGDGKLTKDEYTKFLDGMAAKLKEKGGKAAEFADRIGEAGGKRFDAMDADKKGFVTKEQFEKAAGAGGFGGKGGFKGQKKAE